MTMPLWLSLYCSAFGLWFLYKAHYAFRQGWFGLGSLVAVFAGTLLVVAWV